MGYLDTIKKLEQDTAVQVVQGEDLIVTQKAVDADNSTVAVRIDSPLVGQFWLVLSDTELFDPGDALPVYRPSEIKALKGQGYAPDDLQAVHRAKMMLDGRIVD